MKGCVFIIQVKRYHPVLFIYYYYSIGNMPCVILYIVYYRFLNDYPGQQFATNVQNGVVGWAVTKQKLYLQKIIRQAHSGRELCRHIAKPFTMMTTQSPHKTVSIQLKMIKRRTAINLLKTT